MRRNFGVLLNLQVTLDRGVADDVDAHTSRVHRHTASH